MSELRPYYVAGRAERGEDGFEVIDKHRGEVVARVAWAGPEVLDRAIAAAHAARAPMRRLPLWRRRAALSKLLHGIAARAEAFAETIVAESGKPIRFARGEVARAQDTLRAAIAQLEQLGGQWRSYEVAPYLEGYSGRWQRVPVGACGFVTPFNFPLNLVLHKVAPAIAAGCPFVLKPADKTPLSALMLAELLAETDLPEGSWSILPVRVEHAAPLLEDRRLALFGFTGSAEVGWALAARAGGKRVMLELGGNAAALVDETWDDLREAARRIVLGAFYQAGQSCISVQRVYAVRSVYEPLKAALLEETARVKMGDPREPDVLLGPLVSAAEAQRLQQWIEEALQGGGRLLCGGRAQGAMLPPTWVEQPPRDCRLVREEAFGPVATLAPVEDFDELLRRADDSRYGLQAGLFTRDIYRAERAFDELQVGGLLVGDVPSFRADPMPYGGVRDSGLGREGPRFAIEAMTEPKLLVLRRPTH